ncbi:MAG: hypothetical protein DWQ04_25910, partial [Chloroflexi bacterium]
MGIKEKKVLVGKRPFSPNTLIIKFCGKIIIEQINKDTVCSNQKDLTEAGGYEKRRFMALIKNKFLKKFGIVRNAIKKDIFLEEKLLMEEFQDA